MKNAKPGFAGFFLCLLLCSLFAGRSFAVSPATAAAAQQFTNSISNQVWQSQMMRIGPTMAWSPMDEFRGWYSSYFTIYAKDSVFTGYGVLRREEGSVIWGTKPRSWIEMDGKRLVPSATDSITALNGFGIAKTGIPMGGNWLFIQQVGRMMGYSELPDASITKVSILGGKMLTRGEIRDDAALEKELMKIQVVAIFRDMDRDFSIRLYNRFFSLDTTWKPGKVLGGISSMFTGDSLSSWMMGNFVMRNPTDFAEMTVQAKCWCETGNFGPADSLTARLEALIPNMYSTYQVKGLCALAGGDVPKALRNYQLAYRYAPNNENVLDPIQARIQKLEKITTKAH